MDLNRQALTWLRESYFDQPDGSEAYWSLRGLQADHIAWATLPPAIQRKVAHRLDQVADSRTLPIPSVGWIADVMEHLEQTESPPQFWFFSLLSVLGASMGRKCSYDNGIDIIYPNISILITGPSGRARKTTSIKLPIHLALIKGVLSPIFEKITTPSLIELLALSTAHNDIWVCSEFSSYLKDTGGREDLIPTLLELLDCPDVYGSRTIKRGHTQLKDVFFSILAASTIEGLRDAVPRDMITAGLFNRMITVYGDDSGIDVPFPSKIPTIIKDSLATTLQILASESIEFKLSPDARALYSKWYSTTKAETRQLTGFMAHYRERKPQHAIRIAMALNRSLGFRAEIPLHVLNNAIEVMEWAEPMAKRTLVSLTERDAGRNISLALEFVQKASKCKRIDLERHLIRFLGKTDTSNVIDTLFQVCYLQTDSSLDIWLTKDGERYLNGEI